MIQILEGENLPELANCKRFTKIFCPKFSFLKAEVTFSVAIARLLNS